MKEMGLSVSILLLLATACQAQTRDSCTFDSCALRMEQRFSGVWVVRGVEGEDVTRLGWFGSSLESVVANSDSAFTWALRSDEQRLRGGLLMLLAGVVVGGTTWGARDDPFNGTFWVGLTVGLGIEGLAIWQWKSSENSAGRAVWWYNRDLARREGE